MFKARTQRQWKAVNAASVVIRPLAATVLLAASAGALAPHPVFADSLPAQAPPAGFRSSNNSAGGRILDGALPGVNSAEDAVHAGLKKLNGYFGGTMNVAGAVRSTDGSSTTAFFQATLHGTPVSGLSIIAYADNGSSREAVLFDTSAHFGKSISSLAERLKSMPLPNPQREKGGGTGGAAVTTRVIVPALHPHDAPDNTVGISVPSDWRVPGLGDGRVVVTGPKTEVIVMNRAMTFITAGSPRARQAEQAAQFTHTRMVTAAPVAAFSEDVAEDYVNGNTAFAQANNLPDLQIHIDETKPIKPGWALVSGTRVDGGVKRRFMGTVSAQRGGYDSWILSLWVMSAAVDDFKEAMPTMLAIEKSCTYNADADRRVKAKETAAVIEASKAAMAASKAEHETFMAGQQSRFDSSMAAARASQDAIDRSAAGMIHVIYGTSVLERASDGAHGTFDSNVSAFVAQQDPEHYRVVPLNELRKGIDY